MTVNACVCEQPPYLLSVAKWPVCMSVCVGYWAFPMSKTLQLFWLKVWHKRLMPDTQRCADRCGQMHGAGAAADKSHQMG